MDPVARTRPFFRHERSIPDLPALKAPREAYWGTSLSGIPIALATPFP